MERHIQFKCPETGLNVQHWLVTRPDDESKGTYVSVVCPACTKVHMINSKNGKLLGKDRE